MMHDRFECFCGAGWFTKKELIQHVQKEHPDQKELWICTCCDKAFKDFDEAKEHVLHEHDVFCDECQNKYLYDAFMSVWYFTVEKDIPIQARSEEEAEKKFRSTYGDRPILGIVRPESILYMGERTDG